MGRNHFSKAGGPYFINDGLSHHKENLSKPDTKVLYSIVSGIGFVLAIIGSLIFFL